jgi:hypothetical protein
MATLLLTASVVCNDPNTTLKSTDERRQSYVNAISDWLKKTSVENVVICENTGDMGLGEAVHEVAATQNKYVEYITYIGDAAMVHLRGKGYGDGEIIEYALDNSKALKEGAGGFFKATGRLNVANFDEIKRRIRGNENCFNLMSTVFRRDRQVDTRFFYVQQDYYRDKLLAAYKSVDDRNGHYLERQFYSVLTGDPHVKKFPRLPEIVGASATMGENYRAKSRLRAMFYSFGLYRV